MQGGKKAGKKRKARYRRGGNKGWQQGMRSQAAASQNKNNNKTRGNKNVKTKSKCGQQASAASTAHRQPGILGLPQCRSFLASSVGQYMG